LRQGAISANGKDPHNFRESNCVRAVAVERIGIHSSNSAFDCCHKFAHPTSASGCETKFDTPTLGVDFHHGLSQQFCLGRQNQSRTQPGIVVLQRIPHWHPLQKSGYGDDRVNQLFRHPALDSLADSSTSQERIGMVSADPSLTQHWLFRKVGRLCLRL